MNLCARIFDMYNAAGAREVFVVLSHAASVWWLPSGCACNHVFGGAQHVCDGTDQEITVTSRLSFRLMNFEQKRWSPCGLRLWGAGILRMPSVLRGYAMRGLCM